MNDSPGSDVSSGNRPLQSLPSLPQPSSPTTIDPTVFQALYTLLGDVPFLMEVVSCYLAETPGHLQAMHTAIEQKDQGALRNAAHALKSNSAMIGAIALASLCADLEAVSQSKPLIRVKLLTLVAAVEAEYTRVQAALIREVQIAQNKDDSD
jgi:HPt (histidine-containing phosphotransfer) domain-containing protein